VTGGRGAGAFARLGGALARRPIVVLVAGAAITAALGPLALRTEVRSDLRRFNERRLGVPLDRCDDYFDRRPTQVAIFVAPEGESVLEPVRVRSIQALVRGIEARFPVRAGGVFEALEKELASEDPPRRLEGIEDSDALARLAFSLYVGAPVAFERAARSNLSDDGFLERLRRRAALSNLFPLVPAARAGGPADPGAALSRPIEVPPVRAVRIPFAYEGGEGAQGVRATFLALARHARAHAPPGVEVASTSSELTGAEIDASFGGAVWGFILATGTVVVATLVYRCRAPAYILPPLANLALALVWTLGLLRLLGHDLTFADLAALGIIIGYADDDNNVFGHRYLDEVRLRGRDGAVVRAFAGCGRGLFLTSFTTIVACLTTAASVDSAVRYFWITLSIGFACSSALNFAGNAACRTLWPCAGGTARSREARPFRPLSGLVRIERRHAPAVFLVFAGLTAAAVLGARAVRTRHHHAHFLGERLESKRALELETRYFSPYRTNGVLLEGPVADRAAVEAMRKLVARLDGYETVGRALGRASVESPVELLDALDRRRPMLDRLARPRDYTERFDALLADASTEGSVGRETIGRRARRVLHRDPTTGGYDAALIQFPVDISVPEEAFLATIARLEEDLRDVGFAAAGVRTSLAGQTFAAHLTAIDLKYAAVSSGWQSALLLLAILAVAYRGRVRLAPLALLPVGAAAIWTVGLMPLLGIPLSLMTSSIAALCLGFGIDYTIHVSDRFLEEEAAGAADPVETAVASAGPALVGSMLTTVAGFLVLALPTTPLTRDYGIVSAIAVVLAYVAAVAFYPVLLILFGGRRRERKPA